MHHETLVWVDGVGVEGGGVEIGGQIFSVYNYGEPLEKK